MLPVEMKVGTGLSLGEPRLRDGELRERALEHDPAAEERLALTGPLDDTSHGRGV